MIGRSCAGAGIQCDVAAVGVDRQTVYRSIGAAPDGRVRPDATFALLGEGVFAARMGPPGA